jgi:hypothetical protein
MAHRFPWFGYKASEYLPQKGAEGAKKRKQELDFDRRWRMN